MKDTKKKVKKKDLDKVIDKVLAYNPKKKRKSPRPTPDDNTHGK